MPFQDDQRPIQFTTPLGQYKLLVSNFRGREAVSELFRFQIDAVTEETDPIQFENLLGQTVTVTIEGKQGGDRYFNGLVIGFTQGIREEMFTYYRVEIAPNLWKLTRNAKSCIFQQKSVTDILKIAFHGSRRGLQRRYRNVRPPRVLRAIPRDRFQLRQPPDGRGRHLLFLQAHLQRPHSHAWAIRRRHSPRSGFNPM